MHLWRRRFDGARDGVDSDGDDKERIGVRHSARVSPSEMVMRDFQRRRRLREVDTHKYQALRERDPIILSSSISWKFGTIVKASVQPPSYKSYI
jgi:hypothetical protein